VCEVPLKTYCAASVRYLITVSFGCGKYLGEEQTYFPRNGYVLNHGTFRLFLQKVELKVCNGIFYLSSVTKLKNISTVLATLQPNRSKMYGHALKR